MKLLLLFCVLCTFLSLGLCDPCDWSGATPDAYRPYYTECTPRHSLQPDGHCDMKNALKCKSFCQSSTTFEYGREQPLGGTYARGPGWFGSSDWFRFGCKWSEPVAPLAKGINFDVMSDGISGGLSRASRGVAEVTHIDVLLDENECGYFAFLPMIKTVCGTYTEASGKNCDQKKKSKGNVCAKETSNYAGKLPFYDWAATDYGEPTVRGHMVFVRVDCVGAHRMTSEWQDPRYRLASQHGQALDAKQYEAWRKVWNNPAISDKMLPDTYGPNDKEQVCLSTIQESDNRMKDALLLDCWYRVGQLMDEPDKLLPIKKKGEYVLDHTWYGGCGIYVQYDEDWADDCAVSYAELAAAAIPSTFDCLKKQFYKGKDRWGVKGSHPLRRVGSGEKCGATAVVWGGKGKGISIGNHKMSSKLDNVTLSILENLPNVTAPAGTGFDACTDGPCRPFGELASVTNLSDYGRFDSDSN